MLFLLLCLLGHLHCMFVYNLETGSVTHGTIPNEYPKEYLYVSLPNTDIPACMIAFRAGSPDGNAELVLTERPAKLKWRLRYPDSEDIFVELTFIGVHKYLNRMLFAVYEHLWSRVENFPEFLYKMTRTAMRALNLRYRRDIVKNPDDSIELQLLRVLPDWYDDPTVCITITNLPGASDLTEPSEVLYKLLEMTKGLNSHV